VVSSSVAPRYSRRRGKSAGFLGAWSDFRWSASRPRPPLFGIPAKETIAETRRSGDAETEKTPGTKQRIPCSWVLPDLWLVPAETVDWTDKRYGTSHPFRASALPSFRDQNRGISRTRTRTSRKSLLPASHVAEAPANNPFRLRPCDNSVTAVKKPCRIRFRLANAALDAAMS